MMTRRSISSLVFTLIFTFVFASMGLAQDDEPIKKELLDIEKIQEEENLSENSQIKRLYIFLAVRKGNIFEAFATRGDLDNDKDGFKAIEEPNDLDEYIKLDVEFKKEIAINGDEHTCYITVLPHFEKLFKKENLTDPFEDGDILEVKTSLSEEHENSLIGVKTLPIIKPDGSSAGIERYVAFYNRGKVKKGDKEETAITSYGIIEILVEEA